ncbi:MAG: DnaA/Hda family protein [Phreatobacter sp.]|uniref:HdaA/DnaA family protein n=1 Tax=Phreatobacter sp. TaxID=1966341 RepID=UPI002735F55E|nr:DnaA/Hda family protein [Phreatobacter sp.]MDP2800863.1 DnaA/Hda family protein [Phreatobacter sp.]
MVATAPQAGPRQMALDLALPESLSRDDFLAAPCNVTALELVDSWPDWPARVMALVGPPGAGKSHLGAIWADLAGARRLAARDLAGTVPGDALATGALLLEDAGPKTSEVALFHLLNSAREEDAFVLMTAREAPVSWGVGLKDLASRLRALPAVALAEPEDGLLRSVLVKLFADRQLVVDAEVVEYLARRMERSLDAARRLVAALDREALETGRRLTRPLAAQVLDRIMQPNLI